MKENNMSDQKDQIEYNLSGNITEITSVLVNDFKLSEEEARFVVYNLTMEKKEKVVFTEKELKLWYMNEETPSTAPIYNLPYTIKLTQFKLNLCHSLYKFLGIYVLTGDVKIAALGLEFIWALKHAIQKIKGDEWCVFGRIVDFIHTTDQDTFELKDIIPYDQENECNRKPEEGECIYWNRERCSLNEEHIVKILDNLVNEGVLEKKYQYWRMIK